MGTDQATTGRLFARLRTGLLFVVILLATVLTLSPPQPVLAAGENFTWQGETIAANGGVFDTPQFSPNNITFTKNGDVYTAEQRFTINQTLFCFVDHTITLTSGSSGSLVYRTRDCPGQQSEVNIPVITINGTPPAGAPGGPAPTTGGVAGTAQVQDSTDNSKFISLKNFPIKLTGADYEAQVSTNQLGYFVFSGVPVGNYTVTANGTYNDPEAGTLQVAASATNIVVGAGITTEVRLRQVASLSGTTSEDACEGQIKTVGWLACPLILTASDAAKNLSSFIVGLLKLDTNALFTDPQSSPAYKAAWGGFRNISYALLVIIGLVMVASQIFNIELFSAYTLRKMLPGIILAVVFVTLSWELMEFLYNLSNAAADAVMEIIRVPFEGVQSVEQALRGQATEQSIFAAIGNLLSHVGLAVGAGVVAITYATIGGWGVVLSLLASVALFIFSVFILLAARNVVAFLLVIIAPIAIMCASFEPVKKVFSFWRGLVVAIVITVPGVAAILTITGVASIIAVAAGGVINIITGFIILIAGFILIWTLFLQLDKISGFMGNVASKATGKAQQALAGYRKETIGRRRQEAIEGQRDMNVLGYNLGRGMRRASLAGQAGKGGFFGTQNRARLAAAEQAMMQKSAAKRLEEEGGRMSGDDDAMALAMQGGMTRDRFIREYQQRTGRDGRSALAAMEASFGANIGSQAMRVSAARARWGSVSAYNDFDIDTEEGSRNMYRQMMQDAGEMVADGQMSLTDVVSAMKKNNQRADISGHSFPQMMRQVGLAADRLQAVRGGQTNIQGRVIDEANNVVPGMAQTTGSSVRRNSDGQIVGQGTNLISNSEIDAWMRGALEYAQPGALVAGRTETVRILGRQMRERLDRAVTAEQQAEAVATANPNSTAAQQALEQASRETKRQIAALAGRYDVMAQISPENARFMSENVMQHDINMGAAGQVNIQQLIERWRSDPEFQQYRREYYGSNLAGAQAQQAAAAQAAAGGQPPGQVPTPGPTPSDRWLKRHIRHVGSTRNGTINLYRFKYLWDDQEYVGVMAQEILCSRPDAVEIGSDGYYLVNYKALGIPFLTYETWRDQRSNCRLTN